MDVNRFDFELPEELIAQTPLKNRASSRLFVLDPETDTYQHDRFEHVLDYLNEGDALVINNTRVLPARLYGVKEETGAKIEVLLLHQKDGDTWETLIKPAKRVKEGTTITFGDGRLKATCVSVKEQGGRDVTFSYEGVFLEVLESLGEMPLPPYIKETLQEQERYQTVYSEHVGSAAAPTAGLHFTESLLNKAKEKGVSVVPLTLHVGLGTFRPVSTETVEEHEMHAEYYHLTEEAAETLNNTRQNGGRIIAVGTTSTRTLETIASRHDGTFVSESGWTSIFIYPGYTFRGIDGMITNFHLPKSSLIMLVSAFAGRDFIMSAYQEAINERYRFFSFGDAMLILEGSLSHHDSN